ncbi:hypothetical protein JSQ81_05180 [Sporosarcina sp. Marseille-Q4063]|uniref:hypothetical protein n=1 Tax=Sporosarcina sp. Marseille-Q4063 TaxID=2810514 RepID=UPI001BB09CF8|nr:hypothetical protein [Sporosarcina sp. Marseille-Q4063]QUW22970.1 hypothetical protein JSQ81_05180 [Sporosarcina sp. Marseille-Q4063]
MKVRDSGLFGLSLLLLVIIMLSVYARFSNGGNDAGTLLQENNREVSVEEANDYLASYHKEVGFYKNLGERLREKGYEHSILGIMDDEDDIRIEITLTNKEANEQERVEVKRIFEETAVKYKLDPKIFKVEVSRDENPNG